MGFSVSATMAIFFATFLILFSILYSSVDRAFDAVTESFDDRYDRLSQETQTDLDIISISYLRETDRLEIELQNTGSASLDVRKMDLIVGGTLVDTAAMVAGGVDSDIWLPQESMKITLPDPVLHYDVSVDFRTHAQNDARLDDPGNISVGDNVYIIDGSSVDVFRLDGTFNFTLTDPTNMVSPTDLKAYDGGVYVLDEHTHVDLYTADGTWAGRIIDDPANASDPRALAVDSDYVYIVDGNTHIDRFNRTTGEFVDVLVSNGGTMSAPQDLYVSSHLFVIDSASGEFHVDRYDLDGTGGIRIIEAGVLSSPTDIAVSPSGLDERRLYIVNGSMEIGVFDATGAFLGSFSDALSDSVSGVDVTGRIFVSDGVNGLVVENLGTRVKVVTENGVSEVSIL